VAQDNPDQQKFGKTWETAAEDFVILRYLFVVLTQRNVVADSSSEVQF